jgi:hypothetical protein
MIQCHLLSVKLANRMKRAYPMEARMVAAATAVLMAA